MQPNRRLIIVVAAIAAVVIIVTVVLLSPKGGTPAGLVILNDAEYEKQGAIVKKLAEAPLAKYGDGTILTADDRANLSAALPIYDAMYDYQPQQPQPKFVAGQICEALGEHDLAISELNAFITSASILPPTPITSVNISDAHWVMADALSAEKRWKEALDQVGIALKAYPDTCEYLVTKANIEWNTGKKDEAAKDLKEALRMQPTNARGLKLQTVVSGKAGETRSPAPSQS